MNEVEDRDRRANFLTRALSVEHPAVLPPRIGYAEAAAAAMTAAVLGATPTPTPTTTSAPAMMVGCNASQPACDIRIAESSTGLLAGPELHASGPERPTDGLPLYSALGPLPCNMLRLRGMVAAATRLQAAWQLWRQRWAAHLIQWCWKAVRRRNAAWTQAARVGATAGRAGAAEAEEAAEEAAEAAAEEEELLLGCI